MSGQQNNSKEVYKMPRVQYVSRNFSAASLALIEQANTIIAEYAAQGYDLTLRQLYYQFVSRDYLPNRQQSYKRLGSIINDARLAGLVDWERIEDRTRGLEAITTWGSPTEIINACASQFKTDKWARQPYYPEVWIEKEALAGVFERVCRELRVPHLSCRGYTSQSEMWRAGRRLRLAKSGGRTPIIFHFGDHDPSGIDMSEDIKRRLEMFMGGTEFERLALNMDQVDQYNPPPNPAKDTDARFQSYRDQYGDESWELDALDPAVLSDLVRTAINGILDQALWDEATREEDQHRFLLGEVAANWNDISDQYKEVE